MSSIRRLATWLTRAGPVNDLTTLSDRDLRDLGVGPSSDRHQPPASYFGRQLSLIIKLDRTEGLVQH
jgi:hypothetical protein